MHNMVQYNIEIVSHKEKCWTNVLCCDEYQDFVL